MVANRHPTRSLGRPRGFDPEAALDHAVDLFWAHGFHAVDVDTIAAGVGVRKPSLYRLFGDKEQLFLHALRRYGETVAARPLAAFAAEGDITSAVRAFLTTAVLGMTEEGRPAGCLYACVASGCAETSTRVRESYADGLALTASMLCERFEGDSATGRLPATLAPHDRAGLLIDLMQGLALRARAGTTRAELLSSAAVYADVVLS